MAGEHDIHQKLYRQSKKKSMWDLFDTDAGMDVDRTSDESLAVLQCGFCLLFFFSDIRRILRYHHPQKDLYHMSFINGLEFFHGSVGSFP